MLHTLKYGFACLLFIACFSNASGSNSVDELDSAMAATMHEHDSLYQAFTQLQENSDALKPAELNAQLFELAMEMVWVNQQIYRADSTELYAYKALTYAANLNNDEKIYYAKDAMTYCMYEQARYPEAIAGFSQLLKNPYVARQDSIKADVLDWLSLCYLYSDAHKEAIDYQLEALGIRKNLQDTFGLLNSYYSMGEISEEQHNYAEAIKHYSIALNLCTTMDSVRKYFYSPALDISIGNCFILLGEMDSAYTHIHQGFRNSEFIGDNYLELMALQAMGDYHLEAGHAFSAKEYYAQMLPDALMIDAGGFDIAYWLGMGKVNKMEGNQLAAIAFFRQAVEKIKQDDLLSSLEETYQLMSQSFAEMEQTDSAYVYALQLASVKDSVYSKKSQAQISSLDAGIALLRKENENAEQLLEKDRTIRNLITAGAILLLVLLLAGALMVGFNYKKSLRINKMLANNNKMIKFQNEKLTLYNEDLRQFAYATSHQFKQPLRTIGGFSSLLRHKMGSRVSEEETEYFDFIKGAVDDMSTLLAKLLSYTALENKKVRYTDEDMNEIVGRIESHLPEKLKTCNPHFDIKCLPQITANRDHMLVLFNSLIENAIKFNDSNAPAVSIYCRELHGETQFVVHDNGIGVEEPYQQKVFNLFQRLNDKSDYDGSGMGLPIAKRIVKHYRGDIWMESEAGKGSKLIFTLPDAMLTQHAKSA